MAIYHLSVKPISRKGGRSATAASAYRAAELVHDETTGQTFDYTRKQGVEHTEIVLPVEAARQDINWARDREALWNAAERAENRSNSRVAREYELALPHEMNHGQRVELVRTFSQDIADRYGVAVDFAIHAPHREGDERNYHAHVLSTTRTVEPGGLGEKAQIEWSDGNRRKAGLEPAAQEITHIRERWAELTNERLQELQIEARIDHRSLEQQGIEREPTVHLGPAVASMERRGMATEVGRRIEQERVLAAQQRLEQAAEIGRLARETQQVERSILDLSGDLEGAKRERDLERLRQQQLTAKGQSLEELQRQGREQWLAMRARDQAKEAEPSKERSQEKSLEQSPEPGRGPKLSLEEQQAQGRERWLEMRRAQELEKISGVKPPGPSQQRTQEQGPEKELPLAKGLEGPEIE